jgi:hypothetical protein
MPKCPLAVLFAVGVFAGCASEFRRAQLAPVAQGRSGDRSYVQVREVGAGKWIRPGWSDWSQTGVTLDARNDSSSPLTIDVARATVAYESSGTAESALAHAVAAGPGGLPSRVDMASALPRPVILAPGEQRTFWLVFERFKWPSNARVTLTLVTTEGAPVRVTLRDPANAGPRWTFEPEGKSGLSTRLETQLFGADGYEGVVGIGVWYARGTIRLDLGYWFGLAYARGTDALDRAFTVGFGMSLAWHPLPGAMGIYGSGAMSFADFGTQSGLQDRSWSPSVSVGLESGSEHGPAAFLFYRVGYVHVFDDAVARKDGITFMVGKNLRFW